MIFCHMITENRKFIECQKEECIFYKQGTAKSEWYDGKWMLERRCEHPTQPRTLRRKRANFEELEANGVTISEPYRYKYTETEDWIE